MLTTISLCLTKRPSTSALKLRHYFPESEIINKSTCVEVVFFENETTEKTTLIRKILRKLKESGIKFPNGTSLVIASFFETAMTSVIFCQKDMQLLIELNLKVEFVAYPCVK